MAPARLLDTRDGERVAAESVTEVLVAGRGGVPEDATAVVVNVAVDDPAVAGFVTVYPCGTERPLASNVNFVAGQTTSNNVTVKVGAGGKMCIYTTAPIHLVVDVNGAHVPHGGEGRFDSLNPWRLLDTRDTGIKLGAGDTYQLTVAGRDGIAADATAAVLNVTVTTPDAAGFVTVYPCGTELPLASNLNFATSEEVANAVIAKIGTNGAVCIYTTAPIHLVVDANGAFTPAGIETFGELEPFRLLDTRDTTRVAPGSDTELVVAGHDGIPANATSVVLNVTVVDPLGDGFVTAYPCGTERPLASNVNYTTGKTVPNAVTVAIGDNGNVCLYSKQATHLVVDTSGAFTPTTA